LIIGCLFLLDMLEQTYLNQYINHLRCKKSMLCLLERRNRMGWKEFFKLNKAKVILTVVLLFIGFLFCFLGRYLAVDGSPQPFYVNILRFFCDFGISSHAGMLVFIKYALFIMIQMLLILSIKQKQKSKSQRKIS